jgi:hypothetical protein
MATVKSEENLYGLSKSADYDSEKGVRRVCSRLVAGKIRRDSFEISLECLKAPSIKMDIAE